MNSVASIFSPTTAFRRFRLRLFLAQGAALLFAVLLPGIAMIENHIIILRRRGGNI